MHPSGQTADRDRTAQGAIGNLGHFQMRIHRRTDTHQLAALFQRRNEFPEIPVLQINHILNAAVKTLHVKIMPAMQAPGSQFACAGACEARDGSARAGEPELPAMALLRPTVAACRLRGAGSRKE